MWIAATSTSSSTLSFFQIQCSDSNRKRGFGPRKSNQKATSKEEKGFNLQQRKLASKQSGPSPAAAPGLSVQFDGKSNSRSLDIDFEERLKAIRRAALEQKKVEEQKEFGPIDYDAPVESEKKTIGLGTNIGVGIAVAVFGLVFSLGDFLPGRCCTIGLNLAWLLSHFAYAFFCTKCGCQLSSRKKCQST